MSYTQNPQTGIAAPTNFASDPAPESGAASEQVPHVVSRMTTSGHIEQTCAAAYVPFPAQACKYLLVVNDTDTTVLLRQGPSGVGLPLLAQDKHLLEGITDAAQVAVRRKDGGATAITIQARWCA